ncbi:MAG TPA: hypothetical protein VIL32_05080 [Steroidobacteraceae bacterium]
MSPEINKMQASIRMVCAAVAAIVTALVFVTLATPVAAGDAAEEQAHRAADPSVARGRYLVQIGGCNDCHTAGYGEQGGRIPESEWLLGMPVGFQGPWGTSYPANLRLTVQNLTEAQWLQFARAERLPPMPWFNLRDMSDEDLGAMYRFIRSLGAKGTRMPSAAAPGEPVATPFIVMTPQNLPQQASR